MESGSLTELCTLYTWHDVLDGDVYGFCGHGGRVVAVVAVAVAPDGQSDGHGHDHSLAVISRPGHQP